MLLTYSLYLLLLLHIFPRIPTTSAATPAYTATDLILLNCGSLSNLNDTSSRSWDSDERSSYAPPNAASISLSSMASTMAPSVFQVPYQTARVFRSSFTYAFPVLTGAKFLRLYFYPDTYSGFNTSQSFFSVTANGFTLLSNFSAFLNSPSPSRPSFMKEFVVNVQEKQRLDVTFSPNQNSFAFVNGIEIVSLPDKLYFRGNDVPIKFVDQLFYLKDDTALENLYRLNVGGGADVAIEDDSGPTRGMFRAWSQDDDLIFGENHGWTPHLEDSQINYTNQTPPYSAPEIVYTTARAMANTSISLEWAFPVDSGFYYLLRFHFCEFQREITEQNRRVFTIAVNNQTQETRADVISWSGGRGIPIFRDYITWVPDDGHRGKKNLRLSLFPNMEGLPMYSSALLNGLEIFKLSDIGRSLAASNPGSKTTSSSPAAVVNPPLEKKGKGGSSVVYAVIGSIVGILSLVAALSFLIFRRQRKMKDSGTTSATKTPWVPFSTTSRSTTRTNGSGSSLPSDLCRHFLLREIKIATDNFHEKFLIGRGGFGNVYKGYIDDGATAVAIKRLNPSSNQGAREFLTEIEMLSKLRHHHLVSLIGYCDENGEMILVYDYMANGTLREHLYNSQNSPLSWKKRLQICIDAAEGLHYLHTGAKHAIIHRDIKSTNILLDEKWVAKMSDFGLSKVGPTGGAQTHVSTVVKGSFGYMDPEYYRRQQLTDKSDVYSFAIVLLEVLCARPAIIPSLPKEQVNLAEWAKFCYRKGTFEQIIDSNLKDQIAPECLKKFVETAIHCISDKGIDRPAMSDVLWMLEFAMQQQEGTDCRGSNKVEGGDSFFAASPSLPLLAVGEPDKTDEEMLWGSSEAALSGSKSSGLSTPSSEKLKSGDIFSEIMNPLGR
ncbi:receptor-like protein kinase FERONIA [Sesamum indicum]|uniref:Receptor-like protein kinase FERONIA n=1 Tax=Sesamum indicum TaxID=4182 RepID=A0A6I9ULK0_SESIN|nr:receptor-like protein kinase FERONIA [Sesamum indicum]